MAVEEARVLDLLADLAHQQRDGCPAESRFTEGWCGDRASGDRHIAN